MLLRDKISVIIPCYNSKNYICDAIESVFMQKGSFDIELIVIDDASTDNSLKIIKNCFKDFSSQDIYSNCDCKLIVNSSNFGVAYSRNKGIELASGNYVAFLDSDDIYSPYKLQKQLNLMKDKDAIISCTARELVDENGVSKNNFIKVPTEIHYKDLLKTNRICCSSVLIKSEIIKNFKFEHDEFHEDYYLWLRILKEHQVAYGINLPLLKSRMTTEGKSRNKLKSSIMHYNVYKLIGLNIFQSIYFFVFYIFFGLSKYYLKASIIKYYLRQIIKMGTQYIILPFFYFINRWKKIDNNLVILADAHHEKTPFNMKLVKEALSKNPNLQIIEYYLDFSKHSTLTGLLFSIKFMSIYSKAKYVFICDNFLPVSSCRKKKKTNIIQLWHACGSLKKFGFDAIDDIPKFYKGNVYKNYNLVTVSSKFCIPPFQSAMKQKQNIVNACGISRTDNYFDSNFKNNAISKFYKEHKAAKNKKIVLWAPTFRGKAIDPYIEGSDKIKLLEEKLEKHNFYLITKLHPHYKKVENLRTSKLLTEELITIADFLITDYSSILFDFLLLKENLILFNPDIYQYQKTRGFYFDYNEIPAIQLNNIDDIFEYLIKFNTTHINKDNINKFRTKFLDNCFGNATTRILQQVGLN